MDIQAVLSCLWIWGTRIVAAILVYEVLFRFFKPQYTLVANILMWLGKLPNLQIEPRLETWDGQYNLNLIVTNRALWRIFRRPMKVLAQANLYRKNDDGTTTREGAFNLAGDGRAKGETISLDIDREATVHVISRRMSPIIGQGYLAIIPPVGSPLNTGIYEIEVVLTSWAWSRKIPLGTYRLPELERV
jgi:hypothetical protein